MNEVNFKNLEPIENYEVRFKCFDVPHPQEGYQATFHVSDKDNDGAHYKIDFEMKPTEYNTTEQGNTKSNRDLINEKYGNLEKCFEEVGYKYLVKTISAKELKNETLNLITDISI